MSAENVREFYRNQGLVRGAELERERIIALLEFYDNWDAPEIAFDYVRHMVALIKGEQK